MLCSGSSAPCAQQGCLRHSGPAHRSLFTERSLAIYRVSPPEHGRCLCSRGDAQTARHLPRLTPSSDFGSRCGHFVTLFVSFPGRQDEPLPNDKAGSVRRARSDAKQWDFLANMEPTKMPFVISLPLTPAERRRLRGGTS